MNRRVPLVARILLAMIFGVGLGLLGRRTGWIGWGASGAANSLGKMGIAVVDLIKGLAGPLLFFAIVDAFLRISVRSRDAWRMLSISLCNASIAILVGLTLSNLLRPGVYLAPLVATIRNHSSAARTEGARRIDTLSELFQHLPNNIFKPFLPDALGGSIVSIVILAVLFGLALRKVKVAQIERSESSFQTVEQSVETLYSGVETLLGWVITLIPFAILGVVAQTVLKHGFREISGLSVYLGVAILSMALQVGVVYQGWLIISSISLTKFWRGAREPVVYALGASSSLATLPVTLRALDKMGVSPASARLAACVGTNLNNDGILLYEAMAALCVAQAFGIHLTLGDQMIVALSCLIAGIGIAGVPEAGLISLVVVLTTVRLPTDLVPILLTVDWILSRCRAATNVTSDLVVAILIDRWGRTQDNDGEKTS